MIDGTLLFGQGVVVPCGFFYAPAHVVIGAGDAFGFLDVFDRSVVGVGSDVFAAGLDGVGPKFAAGGVDVMLQLDQSIIKYDTLMSPARIILLGTFKGFLTLFVVTIFQKKTLI